MYILVAYDVSTPDERGAKRLRQVAKKCIRYGQRVQNSVFECLLEPSQYEQLKIDLSKIIDESADNIRFYNLGNNWKRRVESIGKDNTYEADGFLCI